MASPATGNPPDMGLIRRAMAWRVKYRVASRRIPIASLGVHPMNRGGVYPQPEVVKGLALEILRLGFNRAEADHEGVCVEEVPLLEQLSPQNTLIAE